MKKTGNENNYAKKDINTNKKYPRILLRSTVTLLAASGMLISIAGCGQTTIAQSANSAIEKLSVPQMSTQKKTSSSSTSSSNSLDTSSHSSSETTGTQKESNILVKGASGTYSTNPSVALPQKIASSIPNNATVVAPDYAQLQNGIIVNLKTGKKVTNPKITGTASHPADPLAKTDGKTFIPTQISTVRQDIAKANTEVGRSDNNSTHSSSNTNQTSASTNTSTSAYITTNTTRSTAVAQREETTQNLPNYSSFMNMISATSSHTATTTSLSDGDYGAYWGTDNGTSAFYNANNQLFVQQARGIIDVSQWQGTINWQAVKDSGVQGAIIRLTYGWDNGYDSQAVRNMQQCKELGIPFGVYVYSYAYNNATGYDEGSYAAQLLKEAGISPSDLTLGIQYDLEAYSWPQHPHPTSASTYDQVVSGFYNGLKDNGYNNVSIYSYTYYLDNELNDSYIHSKVDWVAAYSPTIGYTDYGSNFRGWQYSDNGTINGINSSVDLDAFGYATFVNNPWTSQASAGLNLSTYALADIPDGKYYINAGVDIDNSLNVPGASTTNGQDLNEWQSNQTGAQIWYFHRNANGSYGIQNVNSGLWLNVIDGGGSGTRVNQWYGNNSTAQQWWLREVNGGIVLEPECGNVALDIQNGSTANGTEIRVWTPNGSKAQTWRITAVNNGTLPLNQDVRVQSANSSTAVMSVIGNSTANLARLNLWQYSPTSSGQDYQISESGNGLYTIENVSTGKVLDDLYGQMLAGTPVDMCSKNGMTTQEWLLRYENGGFVFINANSGLALDLQDGDTNNGTIIRQWTPNQTIAQTWLVTPVCKYNQWQQLVDKNKYTLAQGWYEVSPATANGQRLDDWCGNKANGATVDVYQTNGDTTQKWYVQQNSWNGTISLKNDNTGTWLTLGGNHAAQNNDQVVLWQGNGQLDQDWIAIPNKNNTITLLSAYDPAYAINLPYGVTSNGTQVQEYVNNGTPAQQWNFHFIGSQATLTNSQQLLNERETLANENRNTLAAGYYFVGEYSALYQRLTGNNSSVSVIYKNESSNQSPQVWLLQHNSWNNTISLQNTQNNEWLSLSGSNTAVTDGESVNLQSGDGDLNQDWIATRNSNESITLHSAVDPTYALVLANNDVNVTSINIDDIAQHIGFVPTVSPSQKAQWLQDAQTIESEGTLKTGQDVTFHSELNQNYLLEDKWASMDPGAIVDIYQDNGTIGQTWTVLDHSDGSISLLNNQSGEWLDNLHYVAGQGTAIVQWPGDGRVDQQWIPVINNDESITLHSWLNPYYVVDLTSNTARDYNIVQSQGQDGNTSQNWVVNIQH